MIGIIGAGNLGKAIIDQLKEDVLISDIEEGSYKNIKIINDNKRLAQDCDVIILTVKPQHMKEVVNEIKDYDKLFITFAAGLKIDSYGINRIVRVMTNIAIKNRKGISIYKLSNSCNEEDKKTVEKILGYLGKFIETDNEDDLDIVTGISGSGIAYFIRFMDIFAKTAEELGMDKMVAQQIMQETVVGALSLTENDDYSDIIDQIASKGGSTEQGLKQLDKLDIKSVITKTIDKCKSLGDKNA